MMKMRLKENTVRIAFLILSAAVIFLTVSILLKTSSGCFTALYAVITADILIFYLALRILPFHKKLKLYFRHILSGNYETGLKSSKTSVDEVDYLKSLANKVAAELLAYDQLRADRVSVSYRILELIMNNSIDPVILIDPDKASVRFSRAAMEYLELKNNSIGMDTLKTVSENASFMDFVNKITNEEKVIKEDILTLKTPVKGTIRRFSSISYPIKDTKENVRTVVMFITPQDPPPTVVYE